MCFGCMRGRWIQCHGTLREFVDDVDVRLIGVEDADFGLDNGKHAATLTKGEVGLLHDELIKRDDFEYTYLMNVQRNGAFRELVFLVYALSSYCRCIFIFFFFVVLLASQKPIELYLPRDKFRGQQSPNDHRRVTMGDWDVHLRSLSNSARDSSFSNDPASDPSLLHSVKRLNELCREEKSEDLVARVYPQINKIFQRAVASLSQSKTSYGLLLLEILQFFLDFGDVVLHDADPSLRTFFRSCLSREFADPVVAEATLDFLGAQKKKFLCQFPMLLPQIHMDSGTRGFGFPRGVYKN